MQGFQPGPRHHIGRLRKSGHAILGERNIHEVRAVMHLGTGCMSFISLHVTALAFLILAQAEHDFSQRPDRQNQTIALAPANPWD